MKRSYLFIPIFIFSFIFSQSTVLTMQNGTVNAGETTVIGVDLTNPDEIVSGFQIQIVDWPNYLTVANVDVDVSVTSRTSDFMVVGNEQPDGSFIIVGFSLTGSNIDYGTGSIVDITYTSTTEYSTEIQLSIVPELSVLSDPSASPIEFLVESGIVTVNSAEHANSLLSSESSSSNAPSLSSSSSPASQAPSSS